VKLSKPDFVAKPALERVKAQGLTRKLVGFDVEGPRVPRHGMEVFDGSAAVGTVTSGGFSPCLGRGIGMGYVPASSSKNGSRFSIRGGSADIAATVAARPFYEGAYHSKPKKAQPSG
jgi:aminomethyltransferase